MKIKTSELIGAQLDWAVAKAADIPVNVLAADNPEEKWQVQMASYPHKAFWPHRDWGQGGPMIEKFRPAIVYHNGPDETPMAATREQSPNFMVGDTVLIAAMRAIVAAKLGEEIEVPEELV